MPGLGEPLQTYCRGLLPAGICLRPRSFCDVRAAGIVQRRLACRTGPLAAGADLILAGRPDQWLALPRAPGLPTMLPASSVRLRGSECVGVQFERLDWFLSRVSNQ